MHADEEALSGLGLARLGWPSDAPLPPDGELARVAVEHRDRLEVVTADGVLVVEVDGLLRRAAALDPLEKPSVGDWVVLRKGRVDAVVGRRSALVRRAAGRHAKPQIVATNVDVVFVVTAAGVDVNPRRLERYAAVIAESGARPVVVLTKVDLEGEADLARIHAAWPGVSVVAASGITGLGVERLRAELGAGMTGALVGSSGVGKSTLVNALVGRAVHETAAVRASDARGQHTTTFRALVPIPSASGARGEGGLLVDSPGMRELGAWDADEGVRATFADVEALMTECRFSDCAHEAEPGCAVREALASGTLEAGRLEAFQRLLHEQSAQAELLTPHAREEKRRRIKVLSRAAKARAAEKRGRR